MADDQPCSPHGWTVDTLEAFLSSKIEAIEKRLVEYEERQKERFANLRLSIDGAMLAADKAVNKAEDATGKRFESVNEFRKTLADQTATLLSRTEYNGQHQALVDKSNDLATRVATIETRGSVLDPSVSAALSNMTGDIRMLRESREAMSGRDAGVKDHTALFISVGSVLISVVTAVIILARGVGAQ